MKVAKFEFPSSAKINGRISVICSTASGSQPYQFEWLKNGIPFEKSERISIATTEDGSMLTFRQLKVEDAANYTCIVKNRGGMDAYTARLSMKSKLVTLNVNESWNISILSPSRVDFQAARSAESERNIQC